MCFAPASRNSQTVTLHRCQMRTTGDEGHIRAGLGQGCTKTTANTTCSHHCYAHKHSPALNDILSAGVLPVMRAAAL
jgi:hypothetical protein